MIIFRRRFGVDPLTLSFTPDHPFDWKRWKLYNAYICTIYDPHDHVCM